MKTLIAILTFITTLGAGSIALADTPATLAGPHPHGQEVSGKITLLRSQEQGLEIGAKSDFLDAELLVTLDSEPGKVFGLSIHDNNEATRQIAETLRAAYLNNRPVTIQHRVAPGKSNLKINWVQLGTLPAWAAAH